MRLGEMRQLILGGQRSGKSREAERRALVWLQADSRHEARLIATALAAENDMRERIATHRQHRPEVIATTEAPWLLSAAVAQHAAAHRLLIVECLTLWLTNWLMPLPGSAVDRAQWPGERDRFLAALAAAAGPIVVVSNEIGMGVTPLGRDARRFVDELGLLHQAVAKCCQELTLMVAGQAWRQPVYRPDER